MYRTLGLTNFRCFKELKELELNSINFFVGPNNSGKSTIVKAVQLVNLFAKQNVITHFDLSKLEDNYHNILNWERLLHRTDADIKNEISLSFRYNDINYEFAITANQFDTIVEVTALTIKIETFDLKLEMHDTTCYVQYSFYLDKTKPSITNMDTLNLSSQLQNLEKLYAQKNNELKRLASQKNQKKSKKQSSSSPLPHAISDNIKDIVINLYDSLRSSRIQFKEFIEKPGLLGNKIKDQLLTSFYDLYTESRTIFSKMKTNMALSIPEIESLRDGGITFTETLIKQRGMLSSFEPTGIEFFEAEELIKKHEEEYMDFMEFIDLLDDNFNRLDLILAPYSEKTNINTSIPTIKEELALTNEINTIHDKIQQFKKEIHKLTDSKSSKREKTGTLEYDIDTYLIDDVTIPNIIDYSIDVYLKDRNNAKMSEQEVIARQHLREISQIIRERTNSFLTSLKETQIFKIENYSHFHHITYNISGGLDPFALIVHKYYELKFSDSEDHYMVFFLNKWLKILGVGDKIKIVHLGGGAYHVLVTDGKDTYHLADKGRGSIQVVYILLNLITSVEQSRIIDGYDSVLIMIEEPEVNLHPSLQSKLTDLFYDFSTRYRVQLIIETHSEYMVRQSQVIVSKAETNPFTTTYFESEVDKAPYQMIYRKDGKFENEFGSGFFDTSANQAFEIL